jgi:hypothetical protein
MLMAALLCGCSSNSTTSTLSVGQITGGIDAGVSNGRLSLPVGTVVPIRVSAERVTTRPFAPARREAVDGSSLQLLSSNPAVLQVRPHQAGVFVVIGLAPGNASLSVRPSGSSPSTLAVEVTPLE